MCTLSIHTRLYARHPLIIAGNRDEYEDRPWREPAYHWPQAPGVFAPIDAVSGGSWIGVNRHGLVCAVLNQSRAQSLGSGKRSRGELVVSVLRHASLRSADAWLAQLDAGQYLDFRVLVADVQGARLYSTSDGRLSSLRIEPGAHILSSKGLDSPHCPKAARFLDPLRDSLPSSPAADNWRYFRKLLAEPAREQPKDGFWVDLGNGYRTRSSAIIALDLHARALRFLHSRTPAAAHRGRSAPTPSISQRPRTVVGLREHRPFALRPPSQPHPRARDLP
ncbi:NRDE family protein [Haliangium ochraceum]|uniref:NRDE family protein n=1 Tax=Haliangium ochraceum (strain DSM 14365 / JCM 11303 / SMP-2) TaxID=502025 RepID=D0LRK0_HALO1|nr:NRDE family protein [Haliangium ochraceum]ACY17228.1 protein of unknown function DUF833 [Haliangium ochraceum DSM 14365]